VAYRRDARRRLGRRTAVALAVAGALLLGSTIGLAEYELLGLGFCGRGTVSRALTGPGDMQVLHLPAPGSGVDREVWVYRPRLADSAALPVLYFLHGTPGGPADVFNATGLAIWLDAYLRAGGRPFVVAAVDGNGYRHGDTEWADAVDGADLVETFVTRDAVAAVEGRHRRNAAHRAVAGFSMGGYGAMNLALRHRDLFGAAASFAGYFHVDDPDGMFAGRPDRIAANSPDRHVAAARGLHVLLADGDHDGDSVTAGETGRFAALLAAANIPATTLVAAGRGHEWGIVRDELPALQRFLAVAWPADPD
jgi:S-formylglutathione hydrolase FrmB